MPFMHPLPLVAKSVQKAYPWLGAAVCEEITQAYAHAVYASESESLVDIDVARIKWMIGKWISESHGLAQEAVNAVLDQHLS